MSTWVYNDGGRLASGRKGGAGDCVVRAVSIASGLDYAEVYQHLAEGNATQRASKHVPKRSRSARNGVYVKHKWFKDYMASLSFVWTPTMQIGSGCTVHLCASELPTGRLVVSVSRHYVAMIDGVIHDTSDPSRGNTRCVYGYWKAT